MDLVTRRFLLGALPSTIVLATLPALPALAATPGLTTHMLDTMNGIPAEGVRIDFSVLEADVYRLIATMRTNADGRTPVPLLRVCVSLGTSRFHATNALRPKYPLEEPGWSFPPNATASGVMPKR